VCLRHGLDSWEALSAVGVFSPAGTPAGQGQGDHQVVVLAGSFGSYAGRFDAYVCQFSDQCDRCNRDECDGGQSEGAGGLEIVRIPDTSIKQHSCRGCSTEGDDQNQIAQEIIAALLRGLRNFGAAGYSTLTARATKN
jgi:hypothetical protein